MILSFRTLEGGQTSWGSVAHIIAENLCVQGRRILIVRKEYKNGIGQWTPVNKYALITPGDDHAHVRFHLSDHQTEEESCFPPRPSLTALIKSRCTKQ